MQLACWLRRYVSKFQLTSPLELKSKSLPMLKSRSGTNPHGATSGPALADGPDRRDRERPLSFEALFGLNRLKQAPRRLARKQIILREARSLPECRPRD